MREIIYLETIGLSQLLASEYTNLMTRTLDLAREATAAALGLKPEELAEFEALVEALTGRIGYSMASALTPRLTALNESRGRLFAFLSGSIRQGVSLPAGARQAAASHLERLIRPYGNLRRRPDQQKTVLIDTLIKALADGEAPTWLQALGLEEIARELAVANETYAALSRQRTTEVKENSQENIWELRQRMDPVYTALTTIAFATSVNAPTAATTHFMRQLNATIQEIRYLRNVRKGHARREEGETAT